MAITYPLSIASCQALLRIKSVVFAPSYGQDSSGQASGIILYKDLRPELWVGQVTTAPMLLDAHQDVQAVLETLEGGINSFYLYNPLRRFPLTGQFDESNLKINSVGDDGVSISLKGLPAGKVISRGDMLSFFYGTRPDRALHRVRETVTANGSGVTPEFNVGAVRPGTDEDIAVNMNPAYGEFRMQGSWTPVVDDEMTQHFTFTAIQA